MTIYWNKSILFGNKHIHIPLCVCTTIEECKQTYDMLQSLFKCQRCGKCCSELYTTIRFTEQDLKRIPFNIDIDMNNDISGKPCIFYTDNGCKIYDVRPETCRCFPLFIDYYENEVKGFVIILNYDLRCDNMLIFRERISHIL